MSINGINAEHFSVNQALDPSGKVVKAGKKMRKFVKKTIAPNALLKQQAADKLDLSGAKKVEVAQKLDLTGEKKAAILGDKLDLSGAKKAGILADKIDLTGEKKAGIVGDIIDSTAQKKGTVIGDILDAGSLTHTLNPSEFKDGTPENVFLKGPVIKTKPLPEIWSEKPGLRRQPWDEKPTVTPPIVSLPDILSGKPVENPFEIKPWIDM